MAFFRKWKTHYKHKKFTSDEPNDGENWGFEKPNKDITKISDNKLDINSILAEEEDNDPLFATYEVKYLGCTPIDTKRTAQVTSEAIKTVIANSKAGGRKAKTQKRVRLNITEDALEVIDLLSESTLLKFSMYQIFYCSVDIAHGHTFSFVSAEKDPLTDQDKMSCHVFLCSKRKIAHEITLMVARCFENAYQHWRDHVVEQSKNQKLKMKDSVDGKVFCKQENKANIVQSHAEIHCTENPLIDLAATDNEVRKFLQNSWVSFDDEAHDGLRIAAC